MKETKNLKSAETVERERERAVFSKISFICDAKKLRNRYIKNEKIGCLSKSQSG